MSRWNAWPSRVWRFETRRERNKPCIPDPGHASRFQPLTTKKKLPWTNPFGWRSVPVPTVEMELIHSISDRFQDTEQQPSLYVGVPNAHLYCAVSDDTVRHGASAVGLSIVWEKNWSPWGFQIFLSKTGFLSGLESRSLFSDSGEDAHWGELRAACALQEMLRRSRGARAVGARSGGSWEKRAFLESAPPRAT
ncbi:hypothetical protein NDU88_001039 [Pleurodeles waltl]|uniref:Uncharacterized protein n=1 Tax=Pleurodeles waltl TaxID=8319 RepID=A0AAV7KPB9_PLEWA|nr:hypothetical protein NDU88_001039 [Pleurodeles waltl]